MKKTPFEEFQQAFNPDATEKVKAQAQDIWLAGLGAFSKVQEEGARAFEKLVNDGNEMQRKTQAAAQERVAEMAARVQAAATDMSDRATGQWGRLEGVFEERVAKAMARLNVPTADELAALRARLDELQSSLDQMGVRAKPSARAAAKKTTSHKSK